MKTMPIFRCCIRWYV